MTAYLVDYITPTPRESKLAWFTSYDEAATFFRNLDKGTSAQFYVEGYEHTIYTVRDLDEYEKWTINLDTCEALFQTYYQRAGSDTFDSDLDRVSYALSELKISLDTLAVRTASKLMEEMTTRHISSLFPTGLESLEPPF